MSDSPPQPRSSPAAGCIILATIVGVFGGLIVLYVGVGLWMNRVIDEFASPAPETLPVATIDEDQRRAVMKKLETISTAAANNATSRVTLSADDLNALIATHPLASDFQGNAWIESISAEAITARVSQKLRTLRPRTFRYLNGSIDFLPVLRRTTILAQVTDIQVPGKEVPRKWIESYSSQDLFKVDFSKPEQESLMQSIERVYLEEGQMVIETRTRTGAEKPDRDDD